MIIAGNGGKLDTSADQEVDQSRLHLGLSGLEVITTNESIVPLSKFNGTRNKCVLGRAIDKWNTLEDASHCEDRGWSNFKVAIINCLQEIVCGIIDTGNKLSKTFSVGSPLNDDLVE